MSELMDINRNVTTRYSCRFIVGICVTGRPECINQLAYSGLKYYKIEDEQYLGFEVGVDAPTEKKDQLATEVYALTKERPFLYTICNTIQIIREVLFYESDGKRYV